MRGAPARTIGERGLRLLRLMLLAAASGALAGLASFVFLEALDLVTEIRIEHGWLLFLLPVAGVAVGAAYHHLGGASGRGNALLLEQIHEPTTWVPRRMAPLVFLGTIVSHLFGASVGREGTALQMSGSLTDAVSRALRLAPTDRRTLLVAALAGGFGSVFGVPFAGIVFAMEVQTVGRPRFEAVVPAAVAAFVGDAVVTVLGHEHAVRPQLALDLDAALLARIVALGAACALAATLFVGGTHLLKAWAARLVPHLPARAALGGVAVVALAGLFGRDYLGLSLPLVDDALTGSELAVWVPALKILFTAVSIGCGFPGGEVTPLFVIGATLGGSLAGPLGGDQTVLAAVGFVAVFAGAAGTPFACTVMAVELFGADALVVAVVGCVAAHVLSVHPGIYGRAPGGRRGLWPLPTLEPWVRSCVARRAQGSGSHD